MTVYDSTTMPIEHVISISWPTNISITEMAPMLTEELATYGADVAPMTSRRGAVVVLRKITGSPMLDFFPGSRLIIGLDSRGNYAAWVTGLGYGDTYAHERAVKVLEGSREKRVKRSVVLGRAVDIITGLAFGVIVGVLVTSLAMGG